MKRKTYYRLLVLLLAVGMLGGCGTPMYELTEDEEDIIVTYSAYAVAKHNIFQKDGYMNTYPQEEEPEAESEHQISSEEPEAEVGAGTGDLQDNTTGGQAAETVSLAKVIGHSSDLKVSYKGYETDENYNEGNYFSMGADEGKTFLIMKIRMKNQGDDTVKVNNLKKGLQFFCSINGGDPIPEEMTFAMKLFSTYEGKIKAGESENVVLLFQIDKDQASKISNLELSVTENGTTSKVKL